MSRDLSDDSPNCSNHQGKASVESDDLKAINRVRALRDRSLEFWDKHKPPAAKFASDLEVVALVADHWDKAPLRLRLRALRILAKRFGMLETLYLTRTAAEKFDVPVRLILRLRQEFELPDGRKLRREREEDYWDYRIAEEVYSRRHAGASKAEAIESLLEAHHIEEGLSTRIRSFDNVEHKLKRTRSEGKRKGVPKPSGPFQFQQS